MRCHTCAEYSTDGTYVPLIHQAFAAASASLMELMMQRQGLPDMLQAFKSYFLLARGDLFTTFLELAEAELERNAADVTVTRLQSLLELGRLMAAQGCLLHPWAKPVASKLSFAMYHPGDGNAAPVTPACSGLRCIET